MMTIEITDLKSGEKEVYDYSRMLWYKSCRTCEVVKKEDCKEKDSFSLEYGDIL